MTKFRDIPLKEKLLIVTMLTSGAALLMACAVIVLYDLVLFRETIMQELSMQAHIIEANSAPALTIGDQPAAKKTLEVLRFQPNIIRAVIYDKTGMVFATYPHDVERSIQSSIPEMDTSGFSLQSFSLVREILHNGERVGTILIQSDLNALYARWSGFGGIVLGVFFASSLMALLLSSRLQEGISQPILRLTDLARRVTAEKNYALRAVKSSQDEIGILMETFNGMLDHIQQRDKQLEHNQEQLEEQVASRTSELERLRRRLELILETVEDGIIGLDVEGNTTFLNKAAVEISGWSREELQGTPSHLLLNHSRAEGSPYSREECPMCSSLVDGAIHHGDSDLLWRKDGTPFPVEFFTAPLRDQSGRVIGAVATFKDITERKRTETVLQEAKQAAEAANVAKSRFLANMSHEIRTPMNGVLGMGDLLSHSSLTDRQRRFAESLRRSGQNLLHILNDILDFSKIEAGKLELETVTFSLSDVIEDTIERFSDAAQRKGVELGYSMATDLPTSLEGDPVRLSQLLNNLVSNALKFTSQGEVIMKANVASENSHTCLVCIEVGDTGTGIAPHALSHIFEAFAQADSSTTRKFGGTGLGLAIVKALTQKMGGEIEVTSEEGKGTSFWLSLPMRKSTTPSEPLSAPMTLRGLTVLIVDDNATTRGFLEDLVHSWEMIPDSAVNGHQALDALTAAEERHLPYDVALLDRDLPDMDGLEVASVIKESNSATQLVLLTPLSFDESEEQVARESGIRAFLSKPIRRINLYDCLVRLRESPLSLPREAPSTSSAHSNAPLQLMAHLLLAEDNSVNQEVTRFMGELLKVKLDIVGNGQEAVEAYSRTSYDVILMDCQMPACDGLAASRTIRELENRGRSPEEGGEQEPRASAPSQPQRRVPIVALTAHATSEARESCLAAGMDDFLSKPFRIDQLQSLVNRWLPPEKQITMASYDHAAKTSQQALIPPESPPGEESPIDHAALAKIKVLQRPNSPNILDKILTQYFINTPKLLDTLQQAMTQGETRTIRDSAHTLKSSSAMVGAHGLAKQCKDLENLAEVEMAIEGVKLVATMVSEYARVRAALAKECDGVHQ